MSSTRDVAAGKSFMEAVGFEQAREYFIQVLQKSADQEAVCGLLKISNSFEIEAAVNGLSLVDLNEKFFKWHDAMHPEPAAAASAEPAAASAAAAAAAQTLTFVPESPIPTDDEEDDDTVRPTQEQEQEPTPGVKRLRTADEDGRDDSGTQTQRGSPSLLGSPQNAQEFSLPSLYADDDSQRTNPDPFPQEGEGQEYQLFAAMRDYCTTSTSA